MTEQLQHIEINPKMAKQLILKEWSVKKAANIDLCVAIKKSKKSDDSIIMKY